MKQFDLNKTNYVQKFINNGFVDCGNIISQKDCFSIFNKVKETRNFSSEIFYDKKVYEKKKNFEKYWQNNFPKFYKSVINIKKKFWMRSKHPEAGIKGLNLANEIDTTHIDNNPHIEKILKEILGQNYSLLIKRFVVGLPTLKIPKWILKKIENAQDTNLGDFIKPQYRDMTYFHGIDFHQDVISKGTSTSDFITLYAYLNNIDEKMSPLIVVPKSHIFGITTFPHKIKFLQNKRDIIYNDRRGNKKKLRIKMLTGKAGQVYFWSGLTLHGTQSSSSNKDIRISLRYLFKKNPLTNNNVIDLFNKNIKGPLVGQVRTDKNFKNDSTIKMGHILNRTKLK